MRKEFSVKSRSNRMLNATDLQREGFRALCDRLGLAGAVRFLRQVEPGRGDYSRERDNIVRGARASDIAAAIRRLRR